jgi:hypothetical protein
VSRLMRVLIPCHIASNADSRDPHYGKKVIDRDYPTTEFVEDVSLTVHGRVR